MKKYILLLFIFLFISRIQANIIEADPSNYTSFLSALMPGDTLFLSEGMYTQRLNLFSVVGTEMDPIVIMGSGNETVFIGNACCNTVSLKQSAYLVIRDFKIDGLNIDYIDGIKAEGTSGNWTHHITIENILIVGHGANQQTVAISTKCPSWDWIIRKCTIDAAGTGLYLGNSNGEAPFVNGIVENNLVFNTIGYNMQVKHQNVGSRNISGMTLNGKTIVRHNVFSKQNNASSGGDSRPNLLVGNFPESGDGADDYYEIYGNFLWQNPTESLFQGTGNIMFYNNICVNYGGGAGITFQNHNGFEPRDVKIFHNTVVCNSDWGIRMLNTDPNYQKFVYANAVFSDHDSPIRVIGGGVSTAILQENITGVVAVANNYINNSANDISLIDLYPIEGSLLNSTLVENTLFVEYTDYNLDFNQDEMDWHYRGAYSGEGFNNGWDLELELKIVKDIVLNTTDSFVHIKLNEFPNPTTGKAIIQFPPFVLYAFRVIRMDGKVMHDFQYSHPILTSEMEIDLSNYSEGMYLIALRFEKGWKTVKVLR